MSQAQAGIAYRVQQMGAEQVRNRIREINEEIKAGRPVTQGLKKEVGELSSTLNTQQRILRLNDQAWKANHTTLMTSARVMSALGSVARSALAVTTAWSVASLAFGRTNVQLMETQSELERINAQLADAIARGADEETTSRLEERRNILQATIKDLKSDDVQGAATNLTNLGATLSIIGREAIGVVMKLGPLGLGGALSAIGTIAAVVIAPILALWMALTEGDQVLDLLKMFIPQEFHDQLEAGSKAVDAFFVKTIPNAITGAVASMSQFLGWLGTTFLSALSITWTVAQAGFRGFWNGMVGLVNAGGKAIVDGINSVVRVVVNAVNAIISAINSASSLTGISIPKVHFAPLTFTAIPTIAAANGFDGTVTRPTMFLTGERGPEHIRVTPSSGSGRGGGDVYITINGDVSGEELIDKTRKALRDDLRYDQGFTGFE